MQKITPCLWFDNNGEEAMNFYISVFPNSRIVSASRHGNAGPGPKGSLLVGIFELQGREFMILNGGPAHKLTEAASLMATCENQQQVDELWTRLSEGGEEGRCGWLKDRFGLSWQIVPSILGKLMSDPDPARSGRVMNALLQMRKLDIAVLQQAYAGE